MSDSGSVEAGTEFAIPVLRDWSAAAAAPAPPAPPAPAPAPTPASDKRFDTGHPGSLETPALEIAGDWGKSRRWPVGGLWAVKGPFVLAPSGTNVGVSSTMRSPPPQNLGGRSDTGGHWL
ncbi:hypothetical protein GQ43DRAFT_472042 [Delitschia confertaspora ATCC 74209]|uniref:Uncharacterized protein n=1 Tax=Delitschia confertaspora ATCC 74209 TaxID=1513339 RepID=A0A9P4MYS5_9PLEO|nr:hypothetical protein GQ43DRAFT_472042 [Delitschia confertaspora ATCC 74209]